MTRLGTVVLVAALAFTLAACGSDDPEAADSSSPSESAEMVYVETPTCRKRVHTFLDISSSMFGQGTVRMSVIEEKYEQLNRILDRTVAACSPALEKQIRGAVKSMTMATLSWEYCVDQDKCLPLIEEDMQKADRQLERAEELVDRQAPAD